MTGKTVIRVQTPLAERDVQSLRIGDIVALWGWVFTGRDSTLPRLGQLLQAGELAGTGMELRGSVMFHTTVGPAGYGPTSSNKYSIVSSIPLLSQAGVKMHVGKGAMSAETVEALREHNSIYAVIPPVSALISKVVARQEMIAFPEAGVEAIHRLEVVGLQVVVAVAHGETIFTSGKIGGYPGSE